MAYVFPPEVRLMGSSAAILPGVLIVVKQGRAYDRGVLFGSLPQPGLVAKIVAYSQI